MAEKITISEDGRSARVAGREKKPLSQKLNPIWWFGNDAEQTLDQADWYLPYRPYWERCAGTFATRLKTCGLLCSAFQTRTTRSLAKRP
jgi:hypothetical protein